MLVHPSACSTHTIYLKSESRTNFNFRGVGWLSDGQKYQIWHEAPLGPTC